MANEPKNTLNILFKRLDPEFQYWISLIFPKISVLVAPRGLLYFLTLDQLNMQQKTMVGIFAMKYFTKLRTQRYQTKQNRS